ncbi:FecR family protein [Steroidobacter sp.]|uniref:FecR family protein n=1 Tax=Steroidobacter sp. TaxID=1978227 RepID=UPI001A53E419|nr:FecR domain-containing protein [Steroidobacter sp.]MBL8268796.1 FecR domain-containing protein [Steroidobacter sp.]
MTEQGHSPRWYDKAEDDPIHILASDWFTRLQDPGITLEETLEWQHWMSADARHAEAFARIEAIWNDSWETLRPRRHRAVNYRSWAIAASLAAVAALSALFVSHAPLPWTGAASQTMETLIGENRSVRLSDGSRVTLGGGSRLTVSMAPNSRNIRLLEGEAFFIVAKDPSRPFSVDAGAATVLAVGTEFNVRRGTDRVDVAVVEGQVMVTPDTPSNPVAWLRSTSEQRAPLHLAVGQRTTVDSTGQRSTGALVDPNSVTAWQSGQLVFRQEPLREVVANVNRYALKPIVLDADIGALPFTGTVLSGSAAGWVASLEAAFGLEAKEEAERIVLRRKQ